ncbi:MAG: hypothetical protein JWN04_5637 [Myxococcaceae bacterium]|nr:hypothetical protein [Myxococcaceae bacterium]
MAIARPHTHEPPLTRAQADDVLRYWLAAVRLEETLNVRPRARRAKHTTLTPRLDFPASGQEYFKLPLAGDVAAILSEKKAVQRPFDGELAAFFESWLYLQYRRSEDENELSHLLCFPVVHLPRGELAGLLRCGVRLRFGTAEGKIFRAPSRAERQRQTYPSPPDEARIASSPRSESAWPFFIDTRLLSYPLGLASEQIDALFEALRAHEQIGEAQMLALVIQSLEDAAHEGTDGARTRAKGALDTDMEALLARLTSAIKALLARGQTRAEVYPVGIVIDGTQAKTTWHLQRELVSLTEAEEQDVWKLDSCLGTYLARSPQKDGEAPQRGLFEGPALTTHQRTAAEHFWGSPLTSVQGPPGTGKTTLILHLCAEALLRNVESLLDHKQMGLELTVIASSNNRAVDNVIEPLCAGSGLPLALRVGSRQVCEQTLSAQLRQTASWLQQAEREPSSVRSDALEGALAEFARQRAELDAQLAPRREALAREAERERLANQLAELPGAKKTKKSGVAPLSALSVSAAEAIDKVLAKVERRLGALSELCAAKPGMAQVNAVARHYEQTARRDLPQLEAALLEAGLTLEVPLPPLETPLDVGELMEAWEEGAESFLEQLTALRERVELTRRADKITSQAKKLRARLAELGAALDAPLPASGGHDELSRALFSAAVAVREAWAKVHASPLLEAVEGARRVVEQERSLRPLFRNEPEQATLLCRLFGLWGSTLLSLGNCLPAEPDSVTRVIIDEAGQCHPAHAVSALLRAKSALIIGDVHQLSPVVELTEDDEARLVRACRLKISPLLLRPYRVSTDSHVSAQSVAEQAVATRHSLVDHFRCRPEIIAISNTLCGYGLSVHTPRVRDELPRLLEHPVSLHDLAGEQQRVFGTLCNELELRETLLLIETLLARGAAPSEIAVITPYRGQLDRLRRGLLERHVPLEFSPELLDSEGPTTRSGTGLALGTVHRFQGGERSIVLFSSVVTRVASLGFLNARPNLLNVAVSRAQHHFVCLGARAVLLQGAMTRVLVEAAQPLYG